MNVLQHWDLLTLSYNLHLYITASARLRHDWFCNAELLCTDRNRFSQRLFIRNEDDFSTNPRFNLCRGGEWV